MKRFILTLALLLPLAACGYGGVEVDPRDKEAVEELTRVKKELFIHVTSDYFGRVKLSVVSARGGRPWKLGDFIMGEKIIKVSKAAFGDGHVDILLEPMAADRTRGVWRDVDPPPMSWGEYTYLVTGVFISPATETLFVHIAPKIGQSTVSWY